MGEVAANKSGILDWAKIKDHTSERDTSRVIKKQGTKLGVPITEINVRTKVMPWIDPRAWFEYIIRFGLLHYFAGLRVCEKLRFRARLLEFWENMKRIQPHFSLFCDDDDGGNTCDFSRLVPLYIHGDEGRTLKKGGLMIVSVQPVIGGGFAEKRLKRPKDFDRMQVNFKGHSFSTRLISLVIPKTLYESDQSFFQEAMDKFTDSMKGLLENGVVDSSTGETFRFCIIGVKGDMPFLQKVGGLKRSWNTTVKRGTARTPAKGICFLCLAGTAGFPCEDVSARPDWVRTIGIKDPWDRTPSILATLPHDLKNPAEHFKVDVWHCVHLGLGKSFVSSVVQLTLPFVPATNNDERFQWLTGHYKSFCKRTKRQPHVTKITPYLVSFGDKTGAVGCWHKGALTTVLLAWIVALLYDLHVDDFLKSCRLAAERLNALFGFLYEAPLFLEKNEAEWASMHGTQFLQEYAHFALSQYQLRKPHLFPLYPKMHYIDHIFKRLRWEADDCDKAFNCLSTSCQMDEDAVGKSSRISRRVNIRLVQRRTLERYLLNCYAVWTKFGLIQ